MKQVKYNVHLHNFNSQYDLHPHHHLLYYTLDILKLFRLGQGQLVETSHAITYFHDQITSRLVFYLTRQFVKNFVPLNFHHFYMNMNSILSYTITAIMTTQHVCFKLLSQ